MVKRLTLGQFVQNTLLRLLRHAKGDKRKRHIARAITKLLLEGADGELSKQKLVKKIIALSKQLCARVVGDPGEVGCCCIAVEGLAQECGQMTRLACRMAYGSFKSGPCLKATASSLVAKPKAKSKA